MSALLLRFAGPAQSWGGPNLFVDKIGTELLPTRAGVLGLLAACLGAPRGQWPDWLAATRIAVRVDRAGTPSMDFHTVNAVPERQIDHYTRLRAMSALKKAPKGGAGAVFIRNGDGSTWGGGQTAITERQFLADAVFMVAIEHDTHLGELAAATRYPQFVPYLGRKAYSPAFPLLLGTTRLSAQELLSAVPSQGPGPGTGARLPVADLLVDRNRTDREVHVEAMDREGVLLWATTNLER